MNSIIIVLFLAVVASSTANVEIDKYYNYYWRQYLGEIPPDAIPGGQDINGKITYIGQAYIVHHALKSSSALIPVEIHQGIPSVNVPIYGVKQNTTTDIKILCGADKSRFQWYETDSKHIFDQMHHKHIIVGGTEDYGVTNIGRLTYGKELTIGKVDTFKGYGEAKIYFAKETSELTLDVYQVLVYEEDTLKLNL